MELQLKIKKNLLGLVHEKEPIVKSKFETSCMYN